MVQVSKTAGVNKRAADKRSQIIKASYKKNTIKKNMHKSVSESLNNFRLLAGSNINDNI